MKLFSKIVTLGVALCASLTVDAAVISTNLTAGAGATSGLFMITSNRASVYSVTLQNSGAVGTTIAFYDSPSLGAPYWGTNYIANGNITNVVSYATNYTYSYVGSNGATNWYTNSGIWTSMSQTANGATNAATPVLVLAVGGSSIATYDVDALFVKGIVALDVTATNLTTIIYYRTAQ